MAWTLQDCIGALKQEYPAFYPYAFVEHKGIYVFNLIAKGADPEQAMADMHVVDPEKEAISGSVSIMELLSDASFRDKWRHANLVSHHNDAAVHSQNGGIPTVNGRGFFSERYASSDEIAHGSQAVTGYRVRRSQTVQEHSDYLMHHGIKGQEWGVRNGPPYPLTADKHKAVTQKAQTGNSVDDGRAGNPYVSIAISLASRILMRKVIFPYIADKLKNNIQNSFTADNKKKSKQLISDIADLDKTYDDANPPKQIKGKHSPDEDMAAVNPKYKDGSEPGTSNNCVLCSYTYDLRRRGYDVTALSSSTGNYSEQIAKRLYEKPKMEQARSLTFGMLFDSFARKYPEGARGEFAVHSWYGGGHSMAWEIQNGKFVVFDTQRNLKLAPSDLSNLGFSALNKNNTICRTDNLNLKMSGINQVAAELKSGWKKSLKNKNGIVKE